MKVLVCGPESSGTRIMAQLVESLGVDVVHRSIPDGWSSSFELVHGIDKAIYVSRDWQATILSQLDVGHSARYSSALDAIRDAHCKFAIWAARTGVDWWQVSYESLVDRPGVVATCIAYFLGLKRVVTERPTIADSNARWLGPVERDEGATPLFRGVA